MRESILSPEMFGWTIFALCAGTENPEWWQSTTIPIGRDAWKDEGNIRARKICGECPVRNECRKLADYEEANLGGKLIEMIYAGMGPVERRRARKKEAAIRRRRAASS